LEKQVSNNGLHHFVFCFSAKHASLKRKSKLLLRIRKLCPHGATSLTMDCCFSTLALLKSSWVFWSSTKRTLSSSNYRNIIRFEKR